RDRRLGHRGLVEILELAHLGARQGPLESLVVALDLGDELGDIVVLADTPGGDLLAFTIETADETHLRQQVPRPIAGEVEDAVLLTDLRRLHESPSRIPRGDRLSRA